MVFAAFLTVQFCRKCRHLSYEKFDSDVSFDRKAQSKGTALGTESCQITIFMTDGDGFYIEQYSHF